MSYAISDWKKAVQILKENPKIRVKELRSILCVTYKDAQRLINDYCSTFKVKREIQERTKRDENSLGFKMSKIYNMELKHKS